MGQSSRSVGEGDLESERDNNASIEAGSRLTVDGLLVASKVNGLDTTDLLLDGVGQSRTGDGRGARGSVQSSDECAPLGSVLCQLTGGGPQGGRETSGRHCEGCSEWRLGDTGGGRIEKLEGLSVVKEERRGVDRASLEAYTGAPAPNPRQTQSSDLLDSPNGVGPIFFTSAPSSLALSPLGPAGPAPCTVQDGTAGCGVPNGANGAQLQPSPVWGTGVSTALASRAAIHREESSSTQRQRKVTPLPPVPCLPRVAVSVSILTSHLSYR